MDGSPSRMKAIQASWMVSARAVGVSPGPRKTSTPGRWIVLKANGISRAWAAPNRPSKARESHENRYIQVSAPAP